MPTAVRVSMRRAVAHGLTALAIGAGCGDNGPGPTSSAPSPRPADRFVDVTAEAGIDFVHTSGATGKRYMPEITIGGAAWFDFDGDGDLDLYCVNGNERPDTGGPGSVTNRLYRNNGDGTFTDATAGSGLGDARYGNGVAVGDYDNDGRTDVCVTNLTGPVLYHNEGGGKFRDVSAAAGVNAGGWTTSATFLDYDNDGYLDLYICRYLKYDSGRVCDRNGIPSYCGPRDFGGEVDLLYRNNGDGTFTEVAGAAGVAIPAPGLGVIALDADDDGDVDLYVANDQARNFLFRNNGDGTFTETAELGGMAYGDGGRAQAGMGVDTGDVDLDGRIDLIVTNFADETNTLYLNRGGGFFLDATRAMDLGGPTLPPLGFGVVLFDHDLDGDLDVYIANGHVLDNVDLLRPDSDLGFGQPDLFLDNQDGKRFVDLSATAGAWFAQTRVGRGVAAADYDEDGDVDLFVINMDAGGTLLRNDAVTNPHWLALRLRGTRSNRDGFGAKVTVHLIDPPGATPARRVFECRAGRSYSSACDARVRIGLGSTPAKIDRVEIRWPSGVVQTLRDLPTNQTLTVEEPRGNS